MSSLGESFEYERKFIVEDASIVNGIEADFIVQSYIALREGYVVRMRLVVDVEGESYKRLPQGALDSMWWTFIVNGEWTVRRGVLTVKAPGVEGIRYEAELELPPEVAVHFCRLADNVIIKERYPVIHGDDLWVVDVFLGQNAPLVVAECERDVPVVDLDIPSFCGREITGDFRYSNECLAAFPYGSRGDA
ncbi:MAG: hypothetical protein E7Z94_08700 [Actinomyces ruminicola]|nr:hypothetical protein [Actinomyces ruminicola]